MRKKEAIVLSAYTGVLLCDFEDYHKYAETLFGCTLCEGEVLMLKEDIKERSTKDAMKIVDSVKKKKKSKKYMKNTIFFKKNKKI